jgi:hypothetical protein
MNFKHILNNEWIASRINPRRKHAWLIAAPKSGSTWLTQALKRLLGWTSNSLVNQEWGRREQELDVRPMLLDTHQDLFTTQQHICFSEATRNFIRQFRVRPILLGRNVFDALVSYHDHLMDTTAVPAAFVPAEFATWPREQRLDFVVQLIAPWYASFFASWFSAKRDGEIEFHWVGYEDLFADPVATLEGILEYLKVDRPREKIVGTIESISKQQTRFNVGIVGRGAAAFTLEQRLQIQHLFSYHPTLSFERIGI